MRLRATRLSATGGHTRKRGIDIAALFAAYPGRVGCYYGTKAGPSYSDILARNREALGPNLVVNGDFASGLAGWTVGPSAGDAAVDASGRCVTTLSGANVFAYVTRQFATTPGKIHVACGRFFKGTGTSGNIRAGTTAASANLGSAVGSASDFLFFLFTATTNNTWVSFVGNGTAAGHTQSCDDIQVFEISDWSKLVLFDDANGTVPVFSVFQTSRGRGLLLDASQGLVRGPELCQDVGFDNASLWTLIQPTSGSVTVGGGAATITSVDGSYAAVSPTALNQIPVVGKWYEVSYTVSSATGGGIRVDMAGVPGPVRSGPGAYSHKLQAIGTQTVAVVRGGGVSGGVVTDLSVRELPGNHMQQPTAAARGELSARYNRITNSEFRLGEVGATPTDWVERGNVTGRVVADPLSPSGKAMRVTVSVGGGIATSSDVRVPSSDIVSGASTRIRVLAKRVSGASNASWAAAVSTGTFALTYQYAWYEADFAATSTSNGLFLGSSQVMTFDIAAVDVRPVTDAIPSIPAYQRVTSATDYDDVGFPVYWRGQTDDWAKAHINPNGATKALVMWAGQKMSDAAIGVVFESSINTTNNAGTLALFAPLSTVSPDIGYRSRGSEPPQQKSFSTVLAPARGGVRGISDVAGDYINVAINGVLGSVATTSDQGTGSYTEQDVFFGSRAGTSLFANIREYAPQLILFQQTADAGLSASQIAALDKAYAKAVGVTI